jgi:hypothetical protein
VLKERAGRLIEGVSNASSMSEKRSRQSGRIMNSSGSGRLGGLTADDLRASKEFAGRHKEGIPLMPDVVSGTSCSETNDSDSELQLDGVDGGGASDEESMSWSSTSRPGLETRKDSRGELRKSGKADGMGAAATGVNEGDGSFTGTCGTDTDGIANKEGERLPNAFSMSGRVINPALGGGTGATVSGLAVEEGAASLDASSVTGAEGRGAAGAMLTAAGDRMSGPSGLDWPR